jgi:hypothetical protein
LFTERVLSRKKWLVFCSKLPKEFLGNNDPGIQLLILNSTNNFLAIILLFGHFSLRNFGSSVCVMQCTGVIRDGTLIEKDVWRFLSIVFDLERTNQLNLLPDKDLKDLVD